MEFTRSGDVLAGRYQLTDLLSESREGRFWRAQDTILGRPVAIHVLDAHDERAPRLMAAARSSAAVGDPRMLRVLDAALTDQIAYVVNEWGTGASLENALAANGPMPPDQAAWIAGEVAEMLAAAHERGHAHGRLNPEAVLLDDIGAVRIIGFGVDAALHGLDPDSRDAQRRDQVDAVGILYAALTGKWAGETRSSMPPAPRDHGRVLRPRQVRAGVPRSLDDLCDRVVGSGSDLAPILAGELASRLTGFAGDPVAPLGHPEETGQPAEEPVPALEGSAGVPTEPSLPAARADGAPASALGIAPDVVRPQRARPGTPPANDPSRPLFADETPGYVEAPKPPQPPRRVVPEATFSNWDGSWTGANVAVAQEPDYVAPGRNWVRLAMGVGVLVLLLVAGSIAFNVLTSNESGTTADQSGGDNTSAPQAKSAPAKPIKGIQAKDLDPHGDPPTEYPDLVGNVVNGAGTNEDNPWRTSTYIQQFGPGGLKPGLGIVLNLEGEYAVDRLKFNMVGAPTDISVYVGDSPWTSDPKGQPAGSGSIGTSGEITLKDRPEGSYVLVWLTKIPKVANGFRAEINEIQVIGSDAS